MNIKQELRFLTINLFLIATVFFAVNNVWAAGSATVSWIPPTTDQGGGALTGLAGYKIYYDTSSHWASSCPTDVGTIIDVPSSTATSSRLMNILTPGQTYYFAVMAYDQDNNLSTCATTGAATEVSKLISYSADFNTDHTVNALDYSILHSFFGSSNSTADINKDNTVNSLDFSILHADYGLSF